MTGFGCNWIQVVDQVEITLLHERHWPNPQLPIDYALEIALYIIGEVRSFAFGTNKSKFTELVKDGWLPCDGRQLENKDYKLLFDTIGNSWGSSLVDKYFNLPNFSGAFLRGASLSAQTIDPEYNSRLAPRADLNLPAQYPGDRKSVGSFQRHAIGEHFHPYTEFYITGDSQGQSRTPNKHGNVKAASTGQAGGAETRPVNFSVLQLIYTGEKIQSAITSVLGDYYEKLDQT